MNGEETDFKLTDGLDWHKRFKSLTLQKKEELVAALLKINLQEEAAAARKAKLLALSLPDLKALMEINDLQVSGKKELLVETFFVHEAKIQKEIGAYEAKCREVEAQKRVAFEGKTGGELKELCEKLRCPWHLLFVIFSMMRCLEVHAMTIFYGWKFKEMLPRFVLLLIPALIYLLMNMGSSPESNLTNERS